MDGVEFYPQPGALASFNAYLGVGANVIAFIFALLGTSFFMRKFGLKFCLMAYPSIIGSIVLAILAAKIFGASNFQLMWMLLGAMMAYKGLSYALNKPSSDVMYIPTSKDVKFKSKGWIDMFGGRSIKSVGGWIANPLKGSLTTLFYAGSCISIALVVVWVFIAAFVGRTFDKLQKENKIIE